MKRKQPFEISATVIRQLGEQLISDELTALMELVKNAYDADASYARIVVDLDGRHPAASHPDPGFILVEDDGTGMNADDIRDGWLVISVSGKREMKRQGRLTPKYLRTPLGDKGLGRLSAQRLGSRLDVSSVKEHIEPGQLSFFDKAQFRISVNWDDFREGALLSKVDVLIEDAPRDQSQTGTQLVISGLRNAHIWRGSDQRLDLVDRLTQLISPFAASRPFQVYLTIGGETFDFGVVASQVRKLALSNHRFSWDSSTLKVSGRIKLAALRGTDNSDIYRIAVGNDHGEGFYEFLRKRARIPGLKFGPEPWFISYELDRSTIGGLLPRVAADGSAQGVADPGPFSGEIDQFAYKEDFAVLTGVFSRETSYQSYLKAHSGVRVYRDGFGIPPYGMEGNDWLGLQSGQTSGRSFYGLRPRNTLGYVDISASANSQLVEKTDREGFSRNDASTNFMRLMEEVVRTINQIFNTLRRTYTDYKKTREEELIGFSSPQALLNSMRAVARQAKAMDTVAAHERLDRARDSVEVLTQRLSQGPAAETDEGVQLRRLLEEARTQLNDAHRSIKQIAEFQERSRGLSASADYLERRLDTLQEQLEEFSGLAGLGLTAEAVSHELYTWAERMGRETRALINILRQRKINVPEISIYTATVRSSLSTLRRQLGHLNPSLRNAREDVELISTKAFFTASVTYYHRLARFRDHNIKVELLEPFDDFAMHMNKGKLTQVVDNLVLNSAYWLEEARGRNELAEPSVRIGAKRPFVTIEDNGPGIDPSVEGMLFQPFVSTKPKKVGRGLGLYITQQLLDSIGCEISLLPERNANGRKYIFQLDLTGVVDAR